MTTKYRVPANWTQTPKYKTRTQMLESRKLELRPDPSYDLDGDGIVGGADYLIAKRFDLDGDGKLNEQEKSNALKAIEEGYESNFVWGCESSGINRSFRVIQKRGKTIVDEDFGRVKETYPFKNQAPGRTVSQIKQQRHQEVQETGLKFQKNLDYTFRLEVGQEDLVDTEQYVKNPRYKSFSEKKSQEHQKAREKAGLLRNDSQSPQIPLNFVRKPKYSTKSDMLTQKNQELVNCT